VNEFPISRAKITPPPVREETLSRERLLGWLDTAVLRRVVFVVAEAGYGKTTLLADFTRRTRVRCLWFKLDEPDRDWLTFLHYLVAAGREAVAEFAPATSAVLGQAGAAESSKDAAIQTFASELEQLDDRPTAFIFDDYHLVDGSPDVARIVQRMIRSAPERMSLVFLTRRRPALRVARLHALDEIRELGRDDLRFNRDETARLFSEAYRQPLEDDVLDEVDSRTEGWAASLQLLRSGIRGRNPTEVRAFVRRMSGIEGRLYDYLAEEVVGELPEPLRRFLVRTSVLDRVTPELARAALSAGQGSAATLHEVRAFIQRSEDIGLLSRRGESTRWSHRYHPLIREYLLGKLSDELDTDELRELHRTIAREAEATSWAVAAHHWLEAGEASQVVATVERQISSIASSGQYSLAADYLSRAKFDGSGEIASIVRARIDLYAGHVDRVQTYLRGGLRRSDRHSSEALHLLMSIATSLGDLDAASTLARTLLARADLEAWQVPIARAILAMREIALTGHVEVLAAALEEAALLHERQRRWHLAAVSRFNLAEVRQLAGAYREGADDARKSIEHFQRSGGDASELGPAFALLGAHLAELDQIEDAREAFAQAEGQFRTPLYRFEVAVRRAEYLAAIGSLDDALVVVRRAVDEAGARPTLNTLAMISTVAVDVATQAYASDLALDWLGRFDTSSPTSEMAGMAHQKLSRARLSLFLRLPEAAVQADEALAHAHAQGAMHLAWRAGLVSAVTSGSPERLVMAIAECAPVAPGCLRAEAAVICGALDRLKPLPPVLEESIQRSPAAWRPHFRRRLADPDQGVRLANAQLLDRFGEWEDVPRLRLVARDPAMRRAASKLGKSLARKAAPRIFIHDLGRTTIQVGDRLIEATTMRRKVSAFVTYLLTRPGFMATREQVLEALWPDAPPEVGTNSLHQTIYFLRRELEPNYADDVSPGYVRLEGELVWLDPELVDSASRRFLDLSSASRIHEANDADDAIRLYSGKFAPEFEYEDWAISTRDSLHAAYLELVERTVRHHAANGDWLLGAETARLALAVDPSAEGVERNLISLYHHSGSHAAAAEQYAHFAAAQRAEYGVEPPPLQSIVSAPDLS